MIKGFIKNSDLLEEKVSSVDYLDISSSVETLTEKLQFVNGSQMIGIVGAFGVGKSTLVEQIKKQRENKEQWIHFDAWQFPERKELWDGLVLETAKQLSKLEAVKRKIDGQSGKDKQLAVKTSGSIIKVAVTALTGLPALLEPLFGLVKNLDYFAEKSPARRVFEIQDIFVSLINTIEKDSVVFVVEDIDRSGPDGLFFLETFRQFLSKNSFLKKITVIVAVSNSSYYLNIDTYLKCLDYVEFFSKKSEGSFKSFISDIFEADNELDVAKLSSFFEYIYIKYPDMDMRKIKLILRQANLNYIDLCRRKYEPNKLICIAVSASKYIKVHPNKELSYFDQFVENKIINEGNEICRLILITNNVLVRHQNRLIMNDVKTLEPTSDITFTTRPSPEKTKEFPSIPYPFDDYTGQRIISKTGLPDFYFKDL